MPEESDFLGLQGTEWNDSVQLHTFTEDNRVEEQELIRIVPPRHVSSSTPSTAGSSAPKNLPSASKNLRKPDGGIKGKLVTSTLSTPAHPSPPVKFGPPKGQKSRHEQDSARNSRVSNSTTHGVAPTPNADVGIVVSRGPTPLASRAPTPVPAAADLTQLSSISPALSMDTNAVTPSTAAVVSSSTVSFTTTASASTAQIMPTSVSQTTSASAPPTDASSVATLTAAIPSASLPQIAPVSVSVVNMTTPALKSTPSQSASTAATNEITYSITKSAAHPVSAPPPTVSSSAFAADTPAHVPPAGSVRGSMAESIDQEMRPLSRPQSPDIPPNLLDPDMPPSGSVSVPNLAEGIHAGPPKKQCKHARGTSTAAKPSGKKRRTTTQDSTASVPLLSGTGPVSAPNNAPTWVDAVELFNTDNLGPEWKLLVNSWLKFEQNMQYRAHGRLGTHHRPQVVGDWIQHARPDKYQPDIGKQATFAKEFSAWWQSLQPEWRTVGADDHLPRTIKDWEEIRRLGINGLLSVVAALFFWGLAVQNKGSTLRSAWLNALHDVAYVLEQLA